MAKDLYNDEYARKWIEYAQSGQDGFRQQYLFPYIQKIVARNARLSRRINTSLLDIGCGWGGLIGYLPASIIYTGVDPVTEFFPFIIKSHPDRNLVLKQGELPDNIPAQNHAFRIVVCSMALHCVSDLESSVRTIFAKAMKKGKVIIAEFNDNAPDIIRKGFLETHDDTGNHVSGVYNLAHSIPLVSEAYFHGEANIERAIRAHSSSDIKKTAVGPLFVGYEVNF